MNILLTTDISPFEQGSGAERVVEAHAGELARRGHEVRILCRDSPDHDDTAWQGCRLFPYAVDRTSSVAFVRSTLRNAGRAAEAATTHWRPDAINIHQPFTGFALLRRLRPVPAPMLYTFLSPAPAEFVRQAGAPRGLYPRLTTRGIQWVEDFVLRRAQRISVLSDFMRDEIMRWHPRIDAERLFQVPGGVDTEHFAPLPDRAARRRELGYPADRKLLLTVRNLEPRTGVDNLVEAIGELARSRRDFLLLVAGRGPLQEKIHRRVAELELGDVVDFLGFVAEDELVPLYSVADLYIQPDTDLQGFGLPIVEAMACGTPVIATPVGGALDILQPLDPGLLFSGTAPTLIAGELGAALDNPRVMETRRRYREFAESTYSWPRVVDIVEEALESMVGGQLG